MSSDSWDAPEFWTRFRDRMPKAAVARIVMRSGAVALEMERAGVAGTVDPAVAAQKLSYLEDLFRLIEIRCDTETYAHEIMPPRVQTDVAEVAISLEMWPPPLTYMGPKPTIYDLRSVRIDLFAHIDWSIDEPLKEGLVSELKAWASNWAEWCSIEASSLRANAVSRGGGFHASVAPNPALSEYIERCSELARTFREQNSVAGKVHAAVAWYPVDDDAPEWTVEDADRCIREHPTVEQPCPYN